MSEIILAVDDEPDNLFLIQQFLKSTGHTVVTANNGDEAWNILQARAREVGVILLDRMMPNMDGMALNAKIKASPETQSIPVIMQTSASRHEEIVEGIKSGVYYYLTKPYGRNMLVGLVTAALNQRRSQGALADEVINYKKLHKLIESCTLTFSSVSEAGALASYIANYYPDPDLVYAGIKELLINAVEHGNLGIGYEEKTQLLLGGAWEEEVNDRLTKPDNARKKVTVKYHKTDSEITLLITDEGKGFDWSRYIEFDPARMSDNHGRGIAMARLMSFDEIEYLGVGNQVLCRLKL